MPNLLEIDVTKFKQSWKEYKEDMRREVEANEREEWEEEVYREEMRQEMEAEEAAQIRQEEADMEVKREEEIAEREEFLEEIRRDEEAEERRMIEMEEELGDELYEKEEPLDPEDREAFEHAMNKND